MKKYILLTALIFAVSLKAQKISNDDRAAILNVLEQQRICWNNGDLAGYMKGYWKSDSTRFIGKSGINYGWNATFESYKKGYPNKETMGTLIFKVISLESLNKNSVFMIGKWDLDRKEKAGGYFTLIWEKINGEWFITTDHSS
ncbi:MAG: YybH family protein [Melioribacteraceae bacterium]